MKLKEIGEFGLIDKIKNETLIDSRKVIRGIGDDAAVFSIGKGRVALLTTDILIENVHFIRNKISPHDLGYKSMAVNLSDIAAMGAKPEHAFISIGIPEDIDTDYIDMFYQGVKELAKKYSVNILGGDTSLSTSGLIINIALTGSAVKKNILYRNTARPGDIIYITGNLGDSKAGLYFVINNITNLDHQALKLINVHNKPYPYVHEGIFLAGCRGVHSAMDISDGLGSDLGHIASESNAGFILYEEKLPVSDELINFCSKFSKDISDYALNGGEDYVLAFTADPKNALNIEKSYYKKFNKKLFRIGEITDAPEIILQLKDGKRKAVTGTGWDHFRHNLTVQ